MKPPLGIETLRVQRHRGRDEWNAATKRRGLKPRTYAGRISLDDLTTIRVAHYGTQPGDLLG